MTLRDNRLLRKELIAMMNGTVVEKLDEVLDAHPEQPLREAVLENYERYRSIRKVSTVLSRYYGRHIPQYSVSRILKDNGVEIKTTRPSIYDAQL